MKKSIYLAAAIVLATVSCQRDELVPEYNFSIKATREAGMDTKSTVSDDGAFSWVSGDAIGIYNGSSFNELTTTDNGASATFTGTVVGTPQTCAVFPFAIADTPSSVKLPASYEWVADQANAPMYATYNQSGLAFKHLGGLIKVTVAGVPAAATSFVFTADKDITGTYNIEGGEIKSQSAETGNSVTFTFEAAESAREMSFYVPVPVGSYKMAVALKNGEAELWSFAGSTSNEITRAKLLIMPKLTITSIPGTGEGTDPGTIMVYAKDQLDLEYAFKKGYDVQLDKDIACTSTMYIKDGVDLTIDLNGHTISAPEKVLWVMNAKVNITGPGTIKETKDNGYGALLVSGSATEAENYTVVNVGEDVILAGWSGIFISKDESGNTFNNYGVVINCDGTIFQSPADESHATGGNAIYINGSNKNTTGNVPVINLKNSTVNSPKGTGIYAAGYAEWTLDDCNITAEEAAIEIRAGKLGINGGTYTSTADPFNVAPNGNGTTTAGAALGISQHNTDLPIDVEINGGTFKGVYAIWEKDVQNKTALEAIKLTVNNGTFNGAIYSQNNPNCLVGGNYDDASALDYMGNYDGDIEITMARDGSITTSDFYKNRGGANTSSITLDGNNHVLTFHSSYRNHIQTSNNAKFVIKNATVDSDYKVGGSTWDDYGLIFQCPTEFSNVTFNRQLVLERPFVHNLTGVTIKQTSATGDMYALWITAGADVTFNGGAITALSSNGNKNRAIKIADEYVTDPQITKLNVSGVTFKSDKKAAVLVTSTAGANIVWGAGNNISGVAADQTNAVWNDADRTDAWNLVTVTGCTKYQEQ